MTSTERAQMVALRKLDSDKFREVSEDMVAALASKGLCTPLGNVTDAGRAAIGWKRTSFARSAQLHRISMRAK